jgi:hypothetical protein
LHQLYYFSVDAADKWLEFYPGFLDWVAQHRPASALLKSASYLLHDSQFEKTRTMILSSADYVIQDDTGIPYRFLQQSPWRVRLYGRYHKPIKGLRYGYQADLESAYKTKADVPDLPFPLVIIGDINSPACWWRIGRAWRVLSHSILIRLKYDRPLDLVKAPRVLTQDRAFVFAF